MGRPEGRRRGPGVQRPRAGPGDRGRRQHHTAARNPDGVLRRTGEPLPAARLLPGPARQPHLGAQRRGPRRQPRALGGNQEGVPAQGPPVHGKGRAPQRQHGRQHRAAEEAAAGPGGHRLRTPALVLLREAADGQDAAAGHQDPEGLRHPGHRQPAGPPSKQDPHVRVAQGAGRWREGGGASTSWKVCLTVEKGGTAKRCFSFSCCLSAFQPRLLRALRGARRARSTCTRRLRVPTEGKCWL